MIIELNKNYRLRTDDFNYTLEKITYTKEKKEKRFTVVGHYNNMQRVAEEVIEHGVKTSELEDVYKLIDYMEEMKEQIGQMLTEHENKVIEDVKKIDEHNSARKELKA